MISRTSSLKRDLMTGMVLVNRCIAKRPSLFRRRAYSLCAVLGMASVAMIPMTIIFGAGAAYCWAHGEIDKVEQFAWLYLLLTVSIVWLARGCLAYDLGGVGSETD